MQLEKKYYTVQDKETLELLHQHIIDSDVIAVDTETTGLPKKDKGRPYNYKNLEHFGSSRIVSISWILLDETNTIIEKKTYYIKPDNFVVSEGSIKIHGLTTEFLNKNGVSIHEMLLHLNSIFLQKNITDIIAHNINFDINILKSELYRYKYSLTLEEIRDISLYCTMFKAQKAMKVSKWPKLAEAYRFFYNEDITNAHDAEFDTLYCYKVYYKLQQL